MVLDGFDKITKGIWTMLDGVLSGHERYVVSCCKQGSGHHQKTSPSVHVFPKCNAAGKDRDVDSLHGIANSDPLHVGPRPFCTDDNDNPIYVL